MTADDRPTAAAIARELADLARTLPVGTRMPSEHQLMRRHGVPRATIRRAVQSLVDDHLVRREQGIGTFVHRRVEYVMSRDRAPSLHRLVEETGRTVRSVVIGWDRVPPPVEAARRLGVADGSAWERCERLVFFDDVPAGVTAEWFVPGVLDHADIRLEVCESIQDVLTDAGYDPRRTWARASSEAAPAEVCTRLGLAPGQHTWLLESANVDAATGEPLLCSRGRLRTDLIRVTCELDG